MLSFRTFKRRRFLLLLLAAGIGPLPITKRRPLRAAALRRLIGEAIAVVKRSKINGFSKSRLKTIC
jgi:hypothetical protein